MPRLYARNTNTTRISIPPAPKIKYVKPFSDFIDFLFPIEIFVVFSSVFSLLCSSLDSLLKLFLDLEVSRFLLDSVLFLSVLELVLLAELITSPLLLTVIDGEFSIVRYSASELTASKILVEKL